MKYFLRYAPPLDDNAEPVGFVEVTQAEYCIVEMKIRGRSGRFGEGHVAADRFTSKLVSGRVEYD